MNAIISLDIGTMSTRAFVYDQVGSELFCASYDYHAIFTPPGLVEQNPADWRNGTISTLIEAAAYVRANEIEVDGIVVTSQRASVIPVDWEGRELHNAITWQDKRSAPYCEELIDKVGLAQIYRQTGLRANPYFSLPKMMWFKENLPDIYKEASKLVGVQDYVIHLLTDAFATDHTQAARTMLMDINTFQWDEMMFDASGIDRAKLCDLLPPGSLVPGGLRRGVATVTGLTEGTPVAIAGGDQQCAALALEVTSPGKALANTGTGSFVIAYSENPVFDSECRTLCSAAAIPGKWIAEAGIFNTGATYRWFREQFVPEHLGFREMDEEASKSGPGASGVTMLPHFEGAAAPYWNPNAKGVFFNLSLGTKRGDMERAILEGICFEINEDLDLIADQVGCVDHLSVAGGMVKSDLFNEIQASISALPVVRYDNNEASSLGAAISASVALGWYQDYAAAFAAMADGEKIEFEPSSEDIEIYAEVRKRRNALYNALNESGLYEAFAKKLTP